MLFRHLRKVQFELSGGDQPSLKLSLASMASFGGDSVVLGKSNNTIVAVSGGDMASTGFVEVMVSTSRMSLASLKNGKTINANNDDFAMAVAA